METGSRDYVTIPKGCGYVYAYENQLYNRGNTEGRTKYLKSDVSGHQRFCESCVETVHQQGDRCPLWGQMLTMILRLY